MEFLSGLEFRRKFAQLFECNPSLTNTEAYNILEANSFDVPKTCLEISEKMQESAQEGEFRIPKIALEQLEARETLAKKVKSSQTPEQSQPSIFINNKLPDQEVYDSKIPQVKLREIIEIDDSEDETNQEIVVDDGQNVAQNSADSGTNGSDQAVTGWKRELSDIEMFDDSDVDNASPEDESDSEIDYGSQHLRSAFDPHMKSVEKLNESKQPKSNKSAKSFKLETCTTRFVSIIGGTLFYRELRPIRISEDQTLVESGYKEYREGIVSALDSEKKFLHESLDNLIECQAKCQAGDSVLVQNAKIRVDFRGESDNAGGSEIHLIEEEYHRSADRYFYRFRYDISSESFTEVEEIVKKDQKTLVEECECCSLKKVMCEEKHRPLRILNFDEEQKVATRFIYKGTRYELKDFVYFILKPTSGSRGPHPYNIGQIKDARITSLRGQLDVQLTVDNYERYDDYFQPKRPEEGGVNVPFPIHDNRRVFRWNSKLVNPKDLDGHCFVRHIHHIDDLNNYKDLDDTFWVQDYIPYDLKKDSITVEDLKLMPKEHLTYLKGNKQRLERESKQEVNKMHGTKLNTLDVFSGAGGLSQGLHESGVIGNSYAIESDTVACQNFAKNFPSAIVYNYDANKFLERAMKIDAGYVEGIAYDIAGNLMPKMPAKGDIDMIVGGPPCQGWSRANRKNNPNKILKEPICPMRETIATFLSYVDFYRPKYFLLENVPGIKHHPLNGNDIPNYSPDGGPLKNGAMKFIFRFLTSLGYQCQHATLQAGAYGVPSSRKRVIIWACLPGHKLPKYPEPTNVFKSVPRNPPYLRRSAPHWPINIGDCISDLSLIGVENPHEETKHLTSKNKKNVGSGKQICASTPRSEYQRRVQNSDSCQPLHNHVTGRISVRQNERVRTVPLEAGADYRRMDEKLMTKAMREVLEEMRKNKNYRNKKLEGKYGRLSVDDLFKIFTTTRDKWTLHPYLPRVFTIRELDRGMGFPDSFVWDMVITKLSDVLKQIGNAVPPPFARALGNELRKVLQESGYNNRESKDDEDMIDENEIATHDQANQNMDIVEEILAMSETDSDEEIDYLITAQLERQFNQSTDNQTDAGSEDEDEKNSDADDEVSGESDVDIDGDMEDREDQNDLESEDENESNWSTDEEILNESEVDADEDMEGQVGQGILKFEDDIEQDLDTDERMSEGSDIDADEDMEGGDDLESADEDDMNGAICSEEECVVSTIMQMEERINTGGSRDDAIVIDDSK
ncbi:hypothetical protein ACHAPG_007335 [Botrytis cinerea]